MGRRRPSTAVVVGGAVAILVVGVAISVLLGGGDGGDPPVLRVDLIDDALDAVAEVEGDDAAYFEVNATPDLVNLFVRTEAADGTTNATSYVYDPDQGLSEPQVDPASGATFVAEQVDFEASTVLDAVLQELDTSVPQLFAVNGAGTTEGPSPRVEYRVVMQSLSGGSLSVVVESDGTIVGTDAE